MEGTAKHAQRLVAQTSYLQMTDVTLNAITRRVTTIATNAGRRTKRQFSTLYRKPRQTRWSKAWYMMATMQMTMTKMSASGGRPVMWMI
jgi:hypothetical protein